MSAGPIELDELPYLVGRAWTFGDGIRAQQILPEPVDASAAPAAGLAMGGVDVEFAARIAAGDFIVAGRDFGIGAATPTTVAALQHAGVGALICRSFGANFLRLAVAAGLPPAQVEETAAIKRGDRLRVDIEGHKVVNLSSGDRYIIRNLYDETLDILRAGGLARYRALRA
jgi:3-isopropylmalate/(R)-2-methylmalate dehydratase small subunit